jgi:hypothetical protein
MEFGSVTLKINNQQTLKYRAPNRCGIYMSVDALVDMDVRIQHTKVVHLI